MPLFAKSNNESIFLDELALDYDYLPKLLPHRENQQFRIAECIKPLLQSRTGKNLLITGAPGIGKTAATRFVLRELEEQGLDESIFIIYINCWKKDTSHKATLEICNQLGYKFTHDKSTDQLLKEVSKMMNKKSSVIVLDEVDKLTEFSFLYTLLEDLFKKTIVMITNEKAFLSVLDRRITSRLSPETLEFKPYNFEETLDILGKRAEHAFIPSCWARDALEEIARQSHMLEDIRQGIYLLRECGLIAESSSSRKITIKHAEEAITKLPNAKIISSKDLEKEDTIILELIKAHSGKSSRDIYNIYKDQTGKSFRTFHRKIKDLEKSNMISIKSSNINGVPTAIVNYGKGKNLSDYQ